MPDRWGLKETHSHHTSQEPGASAWSDCGWLVWGSERDHSCPGWVPQPRVYHLSHLCFALNWGSIWWGSISTLHLYVPFLQDLTSSTEQSSSSVQQTLLLYIQKCENEAGLASLMFCSAFSSLPSSATVLLLWVHVSLILCELLAVVGCKTQE